MTNSLKKMLQSYQKLETKVFYLVLALLCIRLIDSAFFLLFNYYMDELGYQDFKIADIVSFRFLAVMLFAFPFGFFIKGRHLRPFFIFGSIIVPIVSLVVIVSAENHWMGLLKTGMIIWGVGFACLQVSALPFILLNVKREQHSEAISLLFLTFSLSIFITGMLNFLFTSIDPEFFSLRRVLRIFSFLGFMSIFFVYKMGKEENPSNKVPFNRAMLAYYDWGRILQAVVPTFIIATGAGLTIQFINLFFLNVHGLGSNTFSMMGSITYGMVAFGMLFMPRIRRKWGYNIAIVLFQVLAVIALFMMCTTEWYKDWKYAIYIAVFFYIIRQPLMNVAGPMTTELTMYFVGKKNQEMLSAINASIWSGSWFVGGQLVSILRKNDLAYVNIFLITVAFYTLGVLWYAYLIRLYKKEEAQKLKENDSITTT